MRIPKYRRRSIIPPKGSIPKGKFKRLLEFIVEKDVELEAEIKGEYKWIDY